MRCQQIWNASTYGPLAHKGKLVSCLSNSFEDFRASLDDIMCVLADSPETSRDLTREGKPRLEAAMKFSNIPPRRNDASLCPQTPKPGRQLLCAILGKFPYVGRSSVSNRPNFCKAGQNPSKLGPDRLSDVSALLQDQSRTESHSVRVFEDTAIVPTELLGVSNVQGFVVAPPWSMFHSGPVDFYATVQGCTAIRKYPGCYSTLSDTYPFWSGGVPA